MNQKIVFKKLWFLFISSKKITPIQIRIHSSRWALTTTRHLLIDFWIVLDGSWKVGLWLVVSVLGWFLDGFGWMLFSEWIFLGNVNILKVTFLSLHDSKVVLGQVILLGRLIKGTGWNDSSRFWQFLSHLIQYVWLFFFCFFRLVSCVWFFFSDKYSRLFLLIAKFWV